jgi:tripartite-type tricarboxylate transporter receptor subunit TctC
MMNRKTFLTLCTALVALSPLAALAQYPDRPVKLIVPFPPGGGTDAAARIIAGAMSDQLGQPMVVENRGGAAGAIGAQAVVDAAPDGYTLFFATTGTMAINQHLYSKLRHNPLTDFTPVATLASFPNVVVVHPSVPARTMRELIDLARSRNGGLTYGSSGAGSSSHLAAVMLESATGVKLTHVPYKGTAPALTDFLSGRIDLMIDNITTHAPLALQGKTRALAVTGRVRSPQLPDVPTVAEAGVPGYDVTIWYALLGPARLPANVVDLLYRRVSVVMGQDKVKEALARIGTDPMLQSPDELARLVREENAKWGEIVRISGARAD